MNLLLTVLNTWATTWHLRFVRYRQWYARRQVVNLTTYWIDGDEYFIADKFCEATGVSLPYGAVYAFPNLSLHTMYKCFIPTHKAHHFIEMLSYNIKVHRIHEKTV